jgi:Tfp pilus assembly protein PilV
MSLLLAMIALAPLQGATLLNLKPARGKSQARCLSEHAVAKSRRTAIYAANVAQ